MKIKELREYSATELDLLLSRIPFFKELKDVDREQLDLMLTYSCLVELQSGEVIMRKGEKGTWLYFLIKGRLAVFRNDQEPTPLNFITPGELFGDLALICAQERKATVAAEQSGKGALLFATDFKPFGDLRTMTPIKLTTKLLFYRSMVHSIRWRLEVSRMEQPNHPLLAKLRAIPLYSGEKGALPELEALHAQARRLAELLNDWNSYQGVGESLFMEESAEQG